MHRRLGFIVSICGVAFTLASFTGILMGADFVMCVAGLTFLVIGVFFAIESVARSK